MKFVMDASAAAALILPDEDSSMMDSLIKKLNSKSEIWVPSLFWFEFGNIFLSAINQKRIDTSLIYEFEKILSYLPIQTDSSEGFAYKQKLISIGIENKLTTYDSSYLELALRKKINLISLDKNLMKAAIKNGLKKVS